MSDKKQSPHSAQAEQQVIGCILRDSANWYTVAPILSEEDFYKANHKLLFRTLTALADAGKPLDAVTVAEYLERKGLLDEAGGMAYASELARDAGASKNAKHHAETVSSLASQRRAMVVARMLHEADGSTAAVEDAITELMSLQSGVHEFSRSIGDTVSAALKRVEDAKTRKGLVGVTTGFHDLDRLTGGFRDTQLYIFGARPSHGKTALLVRMALAAADSGMPVGFISAEQSGEEIGLRAMAISGRVSLENMGAGRLTTLEETKMQDAAVKLQKLPLLLNDQPAVSISNVVRQARQWKHQHGIKALYVDYLQRVKNAGKEKKFEAVGEVAGRLKDIARELKIPVIALAQVNRDCEKRPLGEDKLGCIPKLGDLADSSEIEKEADLIGFLYRPYVYTKSDADETKAFLSIEKYRHGPTGFIPLYWQPGSIRFEDAA